MAEGETHAAALERARTALTEGHPVLVTGPWGVGRSGFLARLAELVPDVRAVDDAHLLDAAATDRLLREVGPALALSVPDGARLADELDDRLDRDGVVRVALEPLTADEVAEVVARRSGRRADQVSAEEAQRLLRWSGGLSALLAATLDDGPTTGSALAVGPALRARVARLLDDLPEPEARVLSTLMGAGAVPVPVADGALPGAPVDRLHERGLLVERLEGEVDDLVVVAGALTHWEAWLPPRRRRELVRSLVVELSEPVCSRLSLHQRVRVARWAAATGGDLALVRLGMRPAMMTGSPDTAVELGRVLLAHDPDDDATRDLLISALEATGDHRAAARTSAAGISREAPDGKPVAPARRSHNVYFATRDEEIARSAALRASDDDAAGDSGQDAANLAWLQVATGDVREARATTAGLLTAPGTAAQARVWAMVLHAVADVVGGGGTACLDLLDVGERFAQTHEESVTPYSSFQVSWTRCVVLIRLGRGDEVEPRVDAALAMTEDRLLRAAWHGVGGFAARETAEFTRGAAHFAALGDALDSDPFGLGSWARSEHDVCRAMSGTAAQVPLDGPSAIGFTEAVLARNEAWTAAVDGVGGAAARAEEAADLARRRGQTTNEVLALVDLARFGRAGLAARLVAELDRVDNPMVLAGGRVVSALARQRPEDLLAAARAAADVGWRVAREELLTTLHAQLVADGRPTAAARVELSQTPSSWPTPILAENDTPRLLTDREAQIGRLAAGGTASGAIAEQLSVSRRTVDNLLGRVYAKCGVPGRRALGDYD